MEEGNSFILLIYKFSGGEIICGKEFLILVPLSNLKLKLV